MGWAGESGAVVVVVFFYLHSIHTLCIVVAMSS